MFKFLHIFVIFAFFTLKFQGMFGNEKLFISDQNNTYYIESEQKFTWYSALARCVSMNMSLVSIDTKIKSDEIKTLLNNTFGNGVYLWIGGCLNSVKPLQFVWVATGKKFVFTNWESSQPNFLNSKDYCVHMESKYIESWFDSECSSPYGFMCEDNQIHKCEEVTKVVKHPRNEPDELNHFRNKPDCHSIFRDIIFNIKP